jgi:hypothetical protein
VSNGNYLSTNIITILLLLLLFSIKWNETNK